ncbi:MAG: peptide chain release factor 2 [Armatimonadota bacterium]
MLEVLSRDLQTYRERLHALGEHLDVAHVREQIAQLEEQTARPGFWDDPREAQETIQQLNALRQRIAGWEELERQWQELQAMAELLEEEEDPELLEELQRGVQELAKRLDTLEMETLLSGEHDANNAILEINAGAGGTESCDWVQMLLRMYLRWAQEHGFRTEILDETPGEVAGLKSVTVRVEGRNAYGLLESERGVHRLVRISPFDANKRRHTSFASVDVIPELSESEEIQINPDDLRIETFRAGSAGGQHMQKNETAVRITHIPTGIVVTCQNERSQQRNRELALRVLMARLAERERRANAERIAALRGEPPPIEWGHQIRSYVFQPYYMVKDHRTEAETGDVPRVMDGDIDLFIQAYLRWKGARKNENKESSS